MLGPGRGSARSCIGAPHTAALTLLFRGSTHIEEPTPHQMHQISDIPPAWFALWGDRGSINFKRLLWLLLISQIAEMENARLQATPAAVPQSEVRFCRDSERESCCQYQAVTACRACTIVLGGSNSKSMSQRYVSSRVLANQLRADRPDCESVL